MDDEEKTLQSLANLMVSNDGLKKQASMVESIPYMLTKNVENGIPAFPSWALTHIGASTIYSHSSGVNQIGLISGKVGVFIFFSLWKMFVWRRKVIPVGNLRSMGHLAP